ncbi:predicted protein [Plenodomus lingam JN3]|uniref:Predicted protein n=1 Tax=Leptosphaeria maculans (strain JN3 / isolate v23.1.3 / race Av1-4-5-6-7-8) TaxID=985895 RepID=E4ZT03_LEPMJ|nr:predicted protein [Plenodomus lingam JN3]CBX94591.1 predicted protein [Plenodomus lingam JN3]
MEMLKRWSIPIHSSQSNHASSQSQTADRQSSSSSLFSRFSEACSSRKNDDVELSDLSVPQDNGGKKPCSSHDSEYEAMPPARALAARERVKNMKAMLRYTGAVSDSLSTQSALPAPVDTCLHHDNNIDADLSSSVQDKNRDADTKEKLYTNTGKVIFAIDGSLESHVVTGLENREKAVPPASPAKSASDGSTTVDLYLGGTKLSEISSTSTNSHNTSPTKAERDTKPSSTPSTKHTPTQLTAAPQSQAILPIPLTPVRNPPATTSATTPLITCRVCAQPLFQSRIVCSKPKAWKVHSGAKGAAHCLHVECLRDAKGDWESDVGETQCARCDAFRVCT